MHQFPSSQIFEIPKYILAVNANSELSINSWQILLDVRRFINLKTKKHNPTKGFQFINMNTIQRMMYLSKDKIHWQSSNESAIKPKEDLMGLSQFLSQSKAAAAI